MITVYDFKKILIFFFGLYFRVTNMIELIEQINNKYLVQSAVVSKR